jgi:Mg2+/Co2+ transporter CorB
MVNGDEEIQLSDLEGWVKDALSQIWGGPKVLQNPILQLKWIQNHIRSSKESPLNAVRELLRGAIVQLKPEGERQYTNEWMLFNLMDLKYLEGWKVKDIAIRLSISEADLYRKQRMAITAISRQIIEIEKAEDQ